jgi:RHS repeat-associated protein
VAPASALAPPGPPLRLAGQLALFVLAAVSCQHDGDAPTRCSPTSTRATTSDRLGSAALVLDHQGEPIARDAHDPYGAPALAWRADGERGPDYRFTGAEDTPASGAVVLGARHYLPALGRWSSPDPYYLHNPAAHLDRPGERNLYRYAANNPVQHIDPTGHGWASWLVKGVVRVFKGASKADEVASVVEDAAIIVGRNSSFGARVLSALSLGTEYLPVSVGDVKDGVRWLRGSDRAADAAGSMRLGGYRELRGGTGTQSHHIIQNKAVTDLPSYNRDMAPAVRLQGSTGEIGSQHYKATAIQREAGGGTYAAERRIGYKALRAAGLSAEQSRQAIEFADRYFQGIGVTPSTPTNIPKNRK